MAHNLRAFLSVWASFAALNSGAKGGLRRSCTMGGGIKVCSLSERTALEA